MNKKCGFLGVSGVSSDSRDLENAIKEGNERAKLAQDILCLQIKKFIGGYAAEMNGLDAVVFTAGICENNAHLREDVMRDMEYLGIKIDTEANKVKRPFADINLISAPDSKVKVYMIPTNEELVIASDTEKLVNNK